MKKSNFARKTIHSRMTDVEYIEHLESRIEKMDNKIEAFMDKMDKAVFSKDGGDNAIKVFKVYAKEIQNLRN